MMEKLNEYLQALVSSSSYELRLEPNKVPYTVSVNGTSEVTTETLQGTQISMMVFPLIPNDVRMQLPSQPEVQFTHPHNLGKFTFTVTKSPAGFIVAVRPYGVDPNVMQTTAQQPEISASASEPQMPTFEFESSSIGVQNTISEQVAASTALPQIEIEDRFELPIIEGMSADMFFSLLVSNGART